MEKHGKQGVKALFSDAATADPATRLRIVGCDGHHTCDTPTQNVTTV
jgi:hypothetical protein